MKNQICGSCRFFKVQDWSCLAAGEMYYVKKTTKACSRWQEIRQTCQSCSLWHAAGPALKIGRCKVTGIAAVAPHWCSEWLGVDYE